MKRILVAVDGSADSLATVRLADALARATSSQLELVHVLELEAAHFPVEHRDTRSRYAEQSERAEQVLAQAQAQIESQAVKRIEHGGPAERLRIMAEDPEVTMVVVGARGHHSILRSLLGSVSQRLVSSCPKTVVVVRSPL